MRWTDLHTPEVTAADGSGPEQTGGSTKQWKRTTQLRTA